MKLFIKITASIIIVFLLSFTFIVFNIKHYSEKPAGTDSTKQLITVKSGQSFATTANILADKKIICSPVKFRILVRAKKLDTKIKAGEYFLSSNLTPGQIINILVSGKVVLYKLTIPEGYNLQQIADLVEQAGFRTSSNFLNALKNQHLRKKLKINADSFEGYLFPETYYFHKDVLSEMIITTMVNRFNAVFLPEWKKRAEQTGFTIHEVITLASIIEKETGADFERPVISSVFHNRLKKRMRLESDPTVIYGIKNFDGNIKKKHLKTMTPYNTYRLKGLPKGPIANPGKEAIYAALYPADTVFLFFVSKKDSTHKFSTNIKDHNKAVRKYQLRKKRKRKSETFKKPHY